MTSPDPSTVHPAWLPAAAFAAVGARTVLVHGAGALVDTVHHEVAQACAGHGGQVLRLRQPGDAVGHPPADLVLTVGTAPQAAHPAAGDPPGTPPGADHDPAHAVRAALAEHLGTLGPEGYALARSDGVTMVLADDQAGLLYGLFHLVRLGEAAFGADLPAQVHRPATPRRMLDHWDNIDVHPFMGQVERGYAGGSLFWRAGQLHTDLSRVRAYGRLLASCGVNAVCINNVNVHAAEVRLLDDRLGDVVAIADQLRGYGVRVHLSVNFASPKVLGGLDTADPCDPRVSHWWAATTRRVVDAVPDFGGYVVKADSEGQPGPFGYGRSHAEGATVLADALAPYGGVVHWRAFVYNHRQDWRDRSTDRARAAHDHFAPLDGQFPANAIVQVKYGPIDFQVREPVSPVLAAMPHTRMAVELQVTQEYTGQQRHACHLGPLWSEVLGFAPWGGDGPTVAAIVAGTGGTTTAGGGIVGVSNVGDDRFWTGHPLAQANLYTFGRLAWEPRLAPAAVLDEWIELTFTPTATADPQLLREVLHAVLDDSWRTYERYAAPLGVGFMVRPGHHYGPDVDGYEYTPWGTYHFADRDGVGVDRTRATGTGFTGQYPQPWCDVYESLATCPDELLLFFHHVPYQHVLHSGVTVIQHIYDTHFDGVRQVAEMARQWQRIGHLVDPAVDARVRERLAEQQRSAQEWCDQINAYFHRKSGVPDALGRRIH